MPTRLFSLSYYSEVGETKRGDYKSSMITTKAVQQNLYFFQRFCNLRKQHTWLSLPIRANEALICLTTSTSTSALSGFPKPLRSSSSWKEVEGGKCDTLEKLWFMLAGGEYIVVFYFKRGDSKETRRHQRQAQLQRLHWQNSTTCKKNLLRVCPLRAAATSWDCRAREHGITKLVSLVQCYRAEAVAFAMASIYYYFLGIVHGLYFQDKRTQATTTTAWLLCKWCKQKN